jgi:hypothetical protein
VDKRTSKKKFQESDYRWDISRILKLGDGLGRSKGHIESSIGEPESYSFSRTEILDGE